MVADFSSLVGLLSSIRESGEFSDIEVKCGSSSFQLHCCVICPQSGFFNGITKHDFQEARSRLVTISDDPFIASKMFDYLYRADYDDHPDTPNDHSERYENKDAGSPEVVPEDQYASPESLPSHWIRARINVQVYVIADKYLIDTLKAVSQKKLESNMENGWDEIGFINVIKDVYGPAFPPRSELCNVLARFALQHVSTLQKSQCFHEIRKEYPQFGYDFSTMLMDRVCELESSAKDGTSENFQCDNKIENLVVPSTATLNTYRIPTRSRRTSYCVNCARSFSSRKSLRQHDTDYHRWCTDCSRSFRSLEKAREHRSRQHGGF